MNNVIIRKCRLEDIEGICELQKQWAMEDITYGFVPADKKYLEERLGEYFYTAEYDSKLIGFVYGLVHEAKDMSVMEDGEKYIEIEDLYINVKYRSSGIGSKLMDKILETARGNGIDRSLLYSSTKDMNEIIRFYKKHDFKTWYIEMFR